MILAIISMQKKKKVGKNQNVRIHGFIMGTSQNKGILIGPLVSVFGLSRLMEVYWDDSKWIC